MSIDIETFNKIAANDKLSATLERLWGENASSAQLAQAIEDAGIDVEVSQVEEFLSQEQAKRAAAIAQEEIDDAQLKKIAGGANGDEEEYDFSCDTSFFCHQNIYAECDANLYVPCNGWVVAGL